jgi:beta-galactosidase
MYRTLYRLGVECDFVFPGSGSLADYDLLLVPPLYVADDDLLARLTAYVEAGGHLLLSFKSGFCDAQAAVRPVMAPGPLREAAGFRYQEFSNLAKPLALKGDPFGAGADNSVSAWAEMIIPESARVLAFYDHPFFGAYPAVMRNVFGKGSLTYLGTFPSDGLFAKILEQELEAAQIPVAPRERPGSLKVRRATTAAGRPVAFYLNFSKDRASFEHTGGPAVELMSGRRVKDGDTLTIGAWDLVILSAELTAAGPRR